MRTFCYLAIQHHIVLNMLLPNNHMPIDDLGVSMQALPQRFLLENEFSLTLKELSLVNVHHSQSFMN